MVTNDSLHMDLVVGNFLWNLSTRKTNKNTEIYVKNPKGKTTERENSTMIMAITMVFLWCAKILSSISHPLLVERDLLFIQVV